MTDTERPPAIVSSSEIVTKEEFAEKWGVSPRTVDQWRYGRNGMPKIPYFRVASKIYLWEGAIVWWLNKMASRPDAYYVDRMDRIKKGKPIGRPRTRRDN